MSRNGKIAIVGGVVVLLVVLLYFFGGRNSDPKPDDTYITDDWTETYNPSDKGPYGTYVLKELLDTVGMFGNFIQLRSDLMNSLRDDPKLNDIYFFVGPTNYLPDSSTNYLMDFVEKGNTAFISARIFPEELLSRFFFDQHEPMEYDDMPYDSVQYLKFTHPDLNSKRYKFKNIYNNKATVKHWNYFKQDNFDLPMGEDPVVLGTNTADHWNYVKIKYGKGYFFLHSTPYCFTNISTLKRDGFMYAERILEHIPPGRVQWDKYSLTPHAKSGNSGEGGGGKKPPRSMLEFIMANPPLVWAMLILLAGAILYALYKGKRMQRVIPAAELKENTSLEYVNTLSSLYMQHGSHAKLISLKEKTFLNFIAERYFIITQKADDKFIEKVAIKSQVGKEKIAEIFELFGQLNNVGEVSDDNLILLHQKIEYFYKNCK